MQVAVGDAMDAAAAQEVLQASGQLLLALALALLGSLKLRVSSYLRVPKR